MVPQAGEEYGNKRQALPQKNFSARHGFCRIFLLLSFTFQMQTFMTYAQTVDYLFHSTPVFEHVGASAYKPGLHTTEALDAHFGHPHRRFKTIHVAGTNGKGSVSHTLAAILQTAGYRVGLYTSPHLVDFRERIRINGECIPEQTVVDFVEQERHFFEPLHPSFFELTTAMAFKYFADQQVDIAVIEVGLGGRLDCTNIITPLLSVITNIGFDHTRFLGNTLAEIASEKAGVIKPGVPVVVGTATVETRPVFLRVADACHAPLVIADEEVELLSVQTATVSSLAGVDLPCLCYATRSFGIVYGQLSGDCQHENANTILHVVLQLRHLGMPLTDDHVRQGMMHVCSLTGLRGRWEVLRAAEPRIVCDTGHNVEAWRWLGRQIAAQPCHTLRIVFGMVDDKDLEGVLALLPTEASYYFCQASTHRAVPVQQVAAAACRHGLQGRAFATVGDAYRAAVEDAHHNDFIFIGGSSYVVANLLTEMDL